MKYIFALAKYYTRPSYWLGMWRGVFASFCAVLGAGELLVNVLGKCSGELKAFADDPRTFEYLLLFSFACSIWNNRPKRKISCNISDVDIPVTIVVGDVLHEDGDYVVACNTTFDTTYNKFVSPDSYQGRVQGKYYPNLEMLDKCMQAELNRYQGCKTPDERIVSKSIRYSPGTVVKTTVHDGRNVYWVALADASCEGAANCYMYDLRRCLQGLWDYIADKGNKTILTMPILGSGRSGLNESRCTIIKEILFSFIAYSRSRKIVEELKVCIYPNDMLHHDIDIDDIKSYLCYNCRENRIYQNDDDGESSACG